MRHIFHPKILDALRGYSFKTFTADAGSGALVGIIALPLAMAFAIASGVKPEAGLITAIIAGFLISVFGGSRVAIGGPTGAFIVLIFETVQQYGVEGLIICTIMAGILLFLMGLFRMGSIIRFIPYPLITGFTAGIAVLIMLSQLKDFFGMSFGQNEAGFFATLKALYQNIHTINPVTVVLSILCFIAIAFWPKKLARILPGPIVVLVLATLVTGIFSLPVATIGSTFGGIPSALPTFKLPVFDANTFQFLLSPAITIALLGAVESLLCAVVADTMIDDEHNPDQELMAQGIANIVTPFFGGLPATGAIVRTATNIRNGGKTPVAGIVHSITILLIMLLAAPLAKYVPLAVLSAILIVMAMRMADWGEFSRLRLYPRSDAIVFLLTFLLTVIFNLTVAVEAGMIVACVLFIRHMSVQSDVKVEPMKEKVKKEDAVTHEVKEYVEPIEDVLVFRISGALFFGAAQKLKIITKSLKQHPKVLILQMGRAISLDATTLLVMDDLIRKSRAEGATIIICGLNEHSEVVMRRAHMLEKISDENILPDLSSALDRARKLLKNEK